MNETLKNRLAEFGQEHLLAFWDELTADQRRRLAEQIAGVDFAAIIELVKKEPEPADFAALSARAEPPPTLRLGAAADCFPGAEIGRASCRERV